MVSNGYNVVLISFGQEGTTNSSPASQILSGNSQESAQPVTVAADGTIQEPAQQPTGPFGDNFFLILVFVMVAVIGFSQYT